MPIVHKNRRGHAYYLHIGRTRTGKPKYFFSRKESGELASELPEGFEVYEHPDGPVYLRRALPRLITDEEVAAVERELGRIGLTRRGFVERNLKTLTVYVADVGGGLEAALGSPRRMGRGDSRNPSQLPPPDDGFRFALPILRAPASGGGSPRALDVPGRESAILPMGSYHRG